MNMRHMIALAAVASAAVAGISAPIQGDYNTALGWMAGEDAIYAERATATGAGSAALASGIYNCSFYGAGAGFATTNLTDCIGIGHRALRCATNLQDVVAIGESALAGATSISNATLINGHIGVFGDSDKFFVRTDSEVAPKDSPVYYADGILYLNVKGIVTSAETWTGYDIYVAPYGDDNAEGTAAAPVRSLSRAIEVATATSAGTKRVCVMPGSYSIPSNLSLTWDNSVGNVNVSFIAPAGADKTYIDGSDTAWVEVEGTDSGDIIYNKNISLNSSFEAGSTNCFDGFTFCNITNTFNTGGSGDQFSELIFTDCSFKNIELKGGGDFHLAFNKCIFENCLVDSSFYCGLNVFATEVAFSNCVIAPSAPSGGNRAKVWYTRMENCFARLPVPELPNWPYPMVVSALIDTTYAAGHVYEDTATSVPMTNTIFAVDGYVSTPNAVSSTNMSYTVLSSVLGEDYRVQDTNVALRVIGYRSAETRKELEVFKRSMLFILGSDAAFAADIKNILNSN